MRGLLDQGKEVNREAFLGPRSDFTPALLFKQAFLKFISSHVHLTVVFYLGK
ncbi:hypothetical protein PMAG_a0220 [Pseudoalteromonas mariniglutinosa NCIMB 1770]|nr:hypothetical protein [Pseudoalteromonas mariniglutinosa NCIMB 1770]